MSDYFKTLYVSKEIIFLIDTKKFSANFWVVLKILQVIDTPKYIGLTDNYLSIYLSLHNPEPSSEYYWDVCMRMVC